MFIKLKIYWIDYSSYVDDKDRITKNVMVLNTEQIMYIMRFEDGLRVTTSDGDNFFVEPEYEKVLLDAIHVDI